MPKRDPMALRTFGVAAVVLTFALVGDNAYDRLQSAFHFASLSPAADARLDAWITPPQYNRPDRPSSLQTAAPNLASKRLLQTAN